MEEVHKSPSSLIRSTFVEAIDTLSKDYQGSSLTDVFITVDKESGEVAFYDDEENKVAEIVIFDWVDKVEELSDDRLFLFYEKLQKTWIKKKCFHL